MLSLAGHEAVDVRGEDAVGAEHAGVEVCHGYAYLRGRGVGEAVDAHQAAHALSYEVESGATAVRACRAEARYGAIDDGRIERAHIFIGKAHAIDDTGAEVVNHHIGVFEHVAHYGETLFALEVEDDAALVAVQRQERRRFAFDEGRPVPARVITAVGLLNLNDISAHVCEQHCAEWTCENLAEVDHLDVLKGEFSVRVLHLGYLQWSVSLSMCQSVN